MKAHRTQFTCVLTIPDRRTTLTTGISIDVPKGLTRQQAVEYIMGRISAEVSRALGLSQLNALDDPNEVVT